MLKITDKIEISSKTIAEAKKKITSVKSLEQEIKKSASQEITKLIEVVLLGGIILSASDIHYEPKDKAVQLRIRMDGLLHNVTLLDKESYRLLLSRIKLLSGLKLNVKDRPQDGSFSIVLHSEKPKEQKELEIRVSALPANFGESVVMRILNPKNLKSVKDLGLREDLLALFLKELQRPNGMIIITGPTGSGKTTTLYAFLKHIQKPEIKIITIEDPIEYQLEGISQTQVDPKKGYDFANGLRSIVRQDPDVILVGEIRDTETVKIALQSALTGHLVFSTLHTNDAAGAIPRLTSLGGDIMNIGPAINMVIAQRLTRKVCPYCAKKRRITQEELKEIKKDMEHFPKGINVPEISEDTLIPEAVGCEKCNFTGYKGRVGIFEAFLLDEKVESFVAKKPTISEIKQEAIKNGMTTMRQDGIIKVLRGTTTLEEINRLTNQ